MKILFVNKFFYLNGGSETVFFQERSYCIENGYDVIDFSMRDKKNINSPYEKYFIPNIHFLDNESYIQKIQNAVSFIHSSVSVKQIEALIENEKPDIAHLHNIYHQLTPSIIATLKKHGVKIILTLHDTKLVCPSYLSLNKGKPCNTCKGKYFWKPFTTNCQDSFFKGMLLSCEAYFHKWKRSYEKVDLFLAPSNFIADHIAQRIPSEKIKIFRNGIDIKKYQPSWKDNGYGLYFGRLSKEKGIQTLLEAHKSLTNPLPLKFAGTGPLENSLSSKYSNVEFLGYKTGRQLNTLIANAAFVVVPSEWYENCSMVVLESMAFGKPVIGSKIGGIPEQVEDGKTGFLFEMGNEKELAEKMMMLSSDKELRNKLGKAAREKLEAEYSLNNHCMELELIYKNLLK